MKANNFNIIFLGTAAASLSPNSSTSTYLVEVGQARILIDSGIGALRQIRRAGISPEDISVVLITHWHIDHFAGLPEVLRARKDSVPISIYGPVMPLLARLYLKLRCGWPGKSFEAISPDFSRNYADFDLQAIPNSHDVDSYGWGISEKSQGKQSIVRRIVVSGDTRPTESMLNAAREADLLVHEATYLDRDARTALIHHHTTAREAAELAVKAGVGALALTHIPNRYSRQEIQAEAQRIFPQALVPSTLDIIHISPLLDHEVKNTAGWAQIRVESEVLRVKKGSD